MFILVFNLAAVIPFCNVLCISKRFWRLSKETRFQRFVLSKETRFSLSDNSASRRRIAFPFSGLFSHSKVTRFPFSDLSVPRRRLAFLSAIYQSLEGDFAFLAAMPLEGGSLSFQRFVQSLEGDPLPFQRFVRPSKETRFSFRDLSVTRRRLRVSCRERPDHRPTVDAKL